MIKLRGVGRALAMLIIVVVTLLISITAANWIYSTTINIERTETLRIHPVSTGRISGGNLILTLEISNLGTEDAWIAKIWINNHGFTPPSTQSRIKIGVGEVRIVEITYPMGGTTATIEVYDRAGNLLQDAGTWQTTEGFTVSKPTTIYIKILSIAGTIVRGKIDIT